MIDLTIIQKIAVWALPVIFAITLHEVAHGWVASFFGDQTARLSGRLSFNPLRHIDPVGTILLPLFMLMVSNFIFGWAKPVPVDARNLRNPRRDMAIVALAGPLSNLLMALFWACIAKVGTYIAYAGNDLIGIPLTYMGGAGIMINVVLAVLNLIPLPPLDGGKVMEAFLPRRAAYYYSRIEPYGFLILVILMVTGILGNFMIVPIFFLIDGIGKLFGLG